jgi:hypothetical protein
VEPPQVEPEARLVALAVAAIRAWLAQPIQAAVAVVPAPLLALVVPASWSFDTQSRKGNKHAFGK